MATLKCNSADVLGDQRRLAGRNNANHFGIEKRSH